MDWTRLRTEPLGWETSPPRTHSCSGKASEQSESLRQCAHSFKKASIKATAPRGWRETQKLKAPAALVQDGEFGSLHPHGGSQQSITPIPEDQAFVLAEWGTEFTWCTDIHVGNTPIHISKSFLKNCFKARTPTMWGQGQGREKAND